MSVAFGCTGQNAAETPTSYGETVPAITAEPFASQIATTMVLEQTVILAEAIPATQTTIGLLELPATVTEEAERGVAYQETPLPTTTTTTESVPVTSETPPAIPHYGTWLRLAECESNGNWHINTGNGFYGGLQFTNQSWKGAGGLKYAQRADWATPEQQMIIAERLLDLQGWNAWPGCSNKLSLR